MGHGAWAPPMISFPPHSNNLSDWEELGDVEEDVEEELEPSDDEVLPEGVELSEADEESVMLHGPDAHKSTGISVYLWKCSKSQNEQCVRGCIT